ncbi:MAG: hypothetical protein ABIP89_11140, partial [Polyangiaceae bacterium]
MTTPFVVQVQVTGVPEQSIASFWLLGEASQEQVALLPLVPAVPLQVRATGVLGFPPPEPLEGGVLDPFPLPPLGPPFATEKHTLDPSGAALQHTSGSAVVAVNPVGHAQ